MSQSQVLLKDVLSSCTWGEGPFANYQGGQISRKLFLQSAYQLSLTLPEKKYVINLCKDRYLFALGFIAVALKSQTNILPPNTAAETIAELSETYSDSYVLGDEASWPGNQPYFYLDPAALKEDVVVVPEDVASLLHPDHLIAILFTSGSTGKAKPNPKFWGQLCLSAQLTAERFGFTREHPAAFIATVPPQHMFGLELSVMQPLCGWGVLVSEVTFYPHDVLQAIERASFPVVLISTPVHMAACMRADHEWPAIDRIISATSKLDESLAIQVETAFSCPLMEIFGSSETGAIASRRTAHEQNWLRFETLQIQQDDQGVTRVKGAQHDQWQELSDQLNILDEDHFELLGRHGDMVKIAGKRASLADLTLKLLSIDGVVDAVVLSPPGRESNVTRLLAFVVVENLTISQINKALLQKIDSVFIPRPMVEVDSLPRNDTGKITKKELDQLIRMHLPNMKRIIDLEVSAQHPSLAGHFPGNPLIPGVVILDKVIEAIKVEFQIPSGTSIEIENSKFVNPLIPPTTMTVSLWQKKENRFEFRVTSKGLDIALGIIKYMP